VKLEHLSQELSAAGHEPLRQIEFVDLYKKRKIAMSAVRQIT